MSGSEETHIHIALQGIFTQNSELIQDSLELHTHSAKRLKELYQIPTIKKGTFPLEKCLIINMQPLTLYIFLLV